MGNTIIKSNDVKILKNDTLLEKEINKILRERTEIFEKIDGEYLEEPVNQIRACCMDIVKENPTDNDFITIKLPKATEDKNCQENCLSTEKYGLQFPGKKIEYCGTKLMKGRGGACDGWMVNNCAKELYENNCIQIEKDPESGKYYKKWNKKCLDKDGNIDYIRDDCACLNSITGYNLNNDPSSKIKGGFLFDNETENPYGITGSVKNNYTKYSVNMFDIPSKSQQPKLFDQKCIAKKSNSKTAESGAYTLPNYDNTENELCMKNFNMIDFDKKTFSNIEQNVNCNSEKIEFINSDKKLFDLVGEKSINKKYTYRIVKEANDLINKKKLIEKELKNIRKEKVEIKSKNKIKENQIKQDFLNKIKKEKTNSILKQSKLRKTINDKGGEIKYLQDSIEEQEEEIYDMQGRIIRLNKERENILSVMDELKKELDEKNKKEEAEKQALLRAEMGEDELSSNSASDETVDDEIIEEEQKASFYVSIGYLIFILVVIVIFYNLNLSKVSLEDD